MMKFCLKWIAFPALGSIAFLGLFYWGYCWGWWGRGNLALQYLFQCACPAISEPSRYPERVEVLVSACSHTSTGIIFGRKHLLVRNTQRGEKYLLDLRNGEKTPFNFEGFFLPDELFIIDDQKHSRYILLDRTDGTQYPITHLQLQKIPGAILSDGQVNPDVLKPFRDAKFVYYFSGREVVFAIASDYRSQSAQNVWIKGSDLPSNDVGRIPDLLEKNYISYSPKSRGFAEAVSPNGAFIARLDGIYLTSTGEKIVENYSLLDKPDPSRPDRNNPKGYLLISGWTHDSSAVVLLGPRMFLVESMPLGASAAIPSLFEFYQPVLKLKVPVQYLPPDTQPGWSIPRLPPVMGFYFLLPIIGVFGLAAVGWVMWRKGKQGSGKTPTPMT